MRKTSLSFTGIIFLTLLILSSLWPLDAQSLMAPSLESISRQIQQNHLGWFEMRADFSLSFQSAAGQQAFCKGRLNYRRLDEKIALTCSDKNGRPLFKIKTEDRLFEFYLPNDKILYQGDIFDLENSTQMEKYISPLNLYRALKPALFIPEKSRILAWDEKQAVLSVSLSPDQTRRLIVASGGLVVEETYQNQNTGQGLVIQRSRFVKIDTFNAHKGFYPHLIRLITFESDSESSHTATFQFENLNFSPLANEGGWDLKIAEGTRIISLDDTKKDALYLNIRPGNPSPA